jgi:hypothetical protein
VLVHPLTDDQVGVHLASAGDQLAGLRAALDADPALRELAASPLMLSVMTLAYWGVAADALPGRGTLQERRTEVFATYVDAMFARRGAAAPYAEAESRRWLAWLARALARQNTTVFQLEGLQPGWLTSSAQRWRYTLADRLGWAVLTGLVLASLHWTLDRFVFGSPTAPLRLWLAIGLGIALPVVGLFGGTREGLAAARPPLRVTLRNALVGAATVSTVLAAAMASFDQAAGLMVALFGGATTGGLLGSLVGPPSRQPRGVVVVETVRWSPAHAVRALGVGLIVGAVCSVAVVMVMLTVPDLAALPLRENPVMMPVILVILASVFGVAFAVTGGLVGGELAQRASPNQGIHRSAGRALRVGLFFWLPYLLIFAPASVHYIALGFGLVGALAYGGYACLSHLALRLVLWRDGAMPLNYVRFLDYATERVFLIRAGGGYIFVHRLLQEYFAGLAAGAQRDLTRASGPPATR